MELATLPYMLMAQDLSSLTGAAPRTKVYGTAFTFVEVYLFSEWALFALIASLALLPV